MLNRLRAVLILIGMIAVACKESGRGRKPDAAATSTATGVEAAGSERCGDKTIRTQRVGTIAINDPVDSLRTCNVIRDTIVPADEGTSARKVFIGFGADTIRAEILDDRVWRIEVISPGIRTADSLGVGTPLRRLLRLKDPRGITGEGRLFVVASDHCGMSFQLSPPGPPTHRGEWDRAALSKLPESTVVSRVLVYACYTAGIYPPALG